jgi:hypothetical protein
MADWVSFGRLQLWRLQQKCQLADETAAPEQSPGFVWQFSIAKPVRIPVPPFSPNIFFKKEEIGSVVLVDQIAAHSMKLTILLAIFCLASAEKEEKPVLIMVAEPRKIFSTLANTDALEWPDHLKDVRPLAVKERWNKGWVPTEDSAVLIHEWDTHVLIQQDGNYALLAAGAIEEGKDLAGSDKITIDGLQELVQINKITIEEYQEKASVIIGKANEGDIKRHTSRTEL